MSRLTQLKDFASTSPARFLAWLIIIVTALRVLLLFFSQVDLGPDETQYWWWGQSFQFGYFSKPPMIGWLIGASTGIFGDAEWAVRLFSPIITGVTTWLIFLITRRLYDEKVGLWAAIVWTTLPAIILSTAILSTDIPLLLFWCLALRAFIGLTEEKSLRWGVVLGVSIGLGMLSKYAMIYFPLCMGLAFILSSQARKALQPLPLLLAGGLAFLIFLPNILWNAANDFQTLAHTQENASWGRDMFNFDEFFEFFTAQFGVAGPIIFGALIWGLITLHKRLPEDGATKGRDLMLIAFALPPISVICVQAFLSKANANWAMTSYPAVTILVTAWLMRAGSIRWLQASTALHVGLTILFMVAATNFAIVDAIGQSNSIKRVRDWDKQAADIARYAENYDVIVVDDRELMGNLLYYMRDAGKPIKAWDINRKVEYHYEAFDKFDPTRYERALLVAKYPQYLYSYVEFENIIEVGVSELDMNVRCPRRYGLYELSGYNPEVETRGLRPPEGIKFSEDDCRPY